VALNIVHVFLLLQLYRNQDVQKKLWDTQKKMKIEYIPSYVRFFPCSNITVGLYIALIFLCVLFMLAAKHKELGLIWNYPQFSPYSFRFLSQGAWTKPLVIRWFVISQVTLWIFLFSCSILTKTFSGALSYYWTTLDSHWQHFLFSFFKRKTSNLIVPNHSISLFWIGLCWSHITNFLFCILSCLSLFASRKVKLCCSWTKMLTEKVYSNNKASGIISLY
jgi:hypothetical protein